MRVLRLVGMSVAVVVTSAAAMIVVMVVVVFMGVLVLVVVFMGVIVVVVATAAVIMVVIMRVCFGVRMMVGRVVARGAVVVVMAVVVAAIVFGSGEGEEVEQPEDHEADAGDEDHRLEDAIWGEIVNDAAGGVKVQEDAAPKEEQSDTDEVGEGAGSVHGAGKVLVEGGEVFHQGDPRAAEEADEGKETEQHGDDDTAFEDGGVHEDEFDVHHGAEDQEGEF